MLPVEVQCRQYFWAQRWSNKPLPRCGKCRAGYCKYRWTSHASKEGTIKKSPDKIWLGRKRALNHFWDKCQIDYLATLHLCHWCTNPLR